MCSSGVRIRLDLSDFVTDYTRFRWIYLPYDSFCTVSDLIDHLRNENDCESDDVISLFLEEPYCLTSWESIKILQPGDIVKVKISKMRRKGKRKRMKTPERVEEAEQETNHIKKRNNESDKSECSSGEVEKVVNGASPKSQKMDDSQVEDKKGRKRKRKRKNKNKNALSKKFSLDHDASLEPEESNEDVNIHPNDSLMSNGVEKAMKTRVEPQESNENEITHPNDSLMSNGVDKAKKTSFDPEDTTTIPVARTNGHNRYAESSNVISAESALLMETSESESPFQNLLNLQGAPKVVVRQRAKSSQRSSSTSVNGSKDSFDHLPDLREMAQIGDKIAFKVLEIQENYTPGLSEYKKATVKMVEGDRVTLVLESKFKTKRNPYGKFEIDLEEEQNELSEVDYQWSELSGTKLLERA